ncbi:MAG: biotin--[acetyl-CoA-carboxylase] ligase [bacterium]
MNKNFKIIGKSEIAEGRILYFKKLSSTQKWAVENLDQLKTGDVIWTKNQTAGIGRLKKIWYTLPNTCLTFSLLLPPFADKELNLLITQIFAVTVGDVLAAQGIDYSYKWPNDILVDKNKISGIIADYIKEKNLIIIGMGLNVNLTKDQAESLHIFQPISSLKIIKNKTYNLKNLLDQFIRTLIGNLNEINTKGKDYVIDIVRKKDHLKDNDIVNLKIDKKIVSGTYQGIDNKGRIQIKNSNNQLQKYWSGELIKS